MCANGGCCNPGNNGVYTCVAAGMNCTINNNAACANGSCGNCGGPGQRCCAVNGGCVCTVENLVGDGTNCVPCGGAGQPCCSWPQNSCNVGRTCQNVGGGQLRCQ